MIINVSNEIINVVKVQEKVYFPIHFTLNIKAVYLCFVYINKVNICDILCIFNGKAEKIG